MALPHSLGISYFAFIKGYWRNFVHRFYSKIVQRNYMRKRAFIIYASFIWTKMLLGLTFTPYKSIKDTVHRPVLIPVIFSPLIAVALLFLTAKIGSLLIVVYGMQREAVALFLSTTFISILFWQLLLIYFFISFLIAAKRKV